MEYKTANPVTVSFAALLAGEVTLSTLEEAFGPSSLGILVVKDLPDSFPKLRKDLLSYSSLLGNLPKEILNTLEVEEAKFLVGWSRGKEKLASGKPDTYKGSYYLNCAFYKDRALDGAEGDYQDAFKEYTMGNVWPNEAETGLAGFKETFEKLCIFIIDVAKLVARACDRFAEANIDGYSPNYLERMIGDSTTTKARLLHYFPPEKTEGDKELDSWCGTHLDHGCLTGLTSALWTDESDLPKNPSIDNVHELAAPPDPDAGLYIMDRSGTLNKVRIPRDALAFQTGEALQCITNNKLKAVPHLVKGPRKNMNQGKISRNTIAVFTQPNLHDKVDKDRDFATFAKEIVERNTVS